jgi:hypothetical protein
MAIADSGATSIFIMEGAKVANKQVAKKPLTNNLPDGNKATKTHICDINIPGLPTVLTGHIVPSLAIASLMGICPLCKAGCTVIFNNEKCDVMLKEKVILRGYKDPTTNLWTLPILNKVCTTPGPTALPQPGPCLSGAPHLPIDASNVQPGVTLATFMHSVQTRANAIKYAHQSLCNPNISTLLKAVRKGFFKGCPNLSEKLLLRYLNPSLAVAKGHMKQPRHSIWSTRHHPAPVAQPAPPLLPLIDNVYTRPAYGAWQGPNVIVDDNNKSIAIIFCFGAFADRNSSIVYHNLTGLFPFMSFDGSVCFYVLYHYESNAILAKPITGLDNMSIFTA